VSPTGAPGKSRYALKREGKLKPKDQKRPNYLQRFCSNWKCKARLAGRKGHGFPSRDGKRLFCGSCWNKG
jgi:hypothetical protein